MRFSYNISKGYAVNSRSGQKLSANPQNEVCVGKGHSLRPLASSISSQAMLPGLALRGQLRITQGSLMEGQKRKSTPHVAIPPKGPSCRRMTRAWRNGGLRGGPSFVQSLGPLSDAHVLIGAQASL